MTKPKILLLDIETAPLRAFVWGMWKQNIAPSQLMNDWRILTWAAKWLDKRTVLYDSAHLHGNTEDDTSVLQSLWNLLDEADIVIAHNGRKFDVPKINTRFLAAGMSPPSPYRQIDTLVEAKRTFRITSNRLDYIAKFLGLEGKAQTGGFQLWADCMDGKKSAFRKMLKYNIQDVRVLEDVYHKLRPWMPNHPNVGVYGQKDKPVCPKCGSSNLQKRGFSYTQTGVYQRYQCQETNCKGWSRERYTQSKPSARKKLLTNAG